MSRSKSSKRASPPALVGGLASASAAMGAAARAVVVEPPRSARKAKAAKPKTRDGKKGIVLYVPPDVPLALRKLALAHGSDVQRMGWRALELLFEEYKTPLPTGATSTIKS
jgi:hypothetical protein